MKKRLMLVILVGLMLSGCASTKWCKPGATQNDFTRDKYDCDMKTRSGSSQMMLVDLDLWFDCMKIEKGWSRCTE